MFYVGSWCNVRLCSLCVVVSSCLILSGRDQERTSTILTLIWRDLERLPHLLTHPTMSLTDPLCTREGGMNRTWGFWQRKDSVRTPITGHSWISESPVFFGGSCIMSEFPIFLNYAMSEFQRMRNVFCKNTRVVHPPSPA